MVSPFLITALLGIARADDDAASEPETPPASDKAPVEETHAAPPEVAPAAVVPAQESPAEVAPAEDPAEDPGAPSPAAATTPPPSGPPPGWRRVDGGGTGPEPTSASPPPWQGLYVDIGLLGGGSIFSVGLLGTLGELVAIDGSIGLRLGLDADLHALPIGSLGVVLTGGPTLRHGAFLRGGATLPTADWSESLVTAGYTVRIPLKGGTWMGAELGGGWMLTQELPGQDPRWPGIATVRAVMDLPTTRAQREPRSG